MPPAALGSVRTQYRQGCFHPQKGTKWLIQQKVTYSKTSAKAERRQPVRDYVGKKSILYLANFFTIRTVLEHNVYIDTFLIERIKQLTLPLMT